MDLPVAQYKSQILECYDRNSVLLIVGETGSGKTTQIPQYIYEHCQKDDLRKGGMIAITQPRRVAAMSLAKRVSEEMKTKLGQLVGYNVRFDEVCSKETRIKFVTDGMLLREVLTDPTLSRYHTIILDEAHERTLRTDILFGIVKRLLTANATPTKIKRKTPLKVVIMSATMNAQKFMDFFEGQAHLFRVPGRQFPVRLFYTSEAQQDYLDAAVVSIFQLHQEKPTNPGDILVFLTGQEEIEAVNKILTEHAPQCPKGTPKMIICPIYASLPAHQQMAVFAPTPEGCRKVILATNIAETSITIPGIRYVIDPGMVKMRSFVAKAGVETLTVVPTSKASCRQRTGRAGREGEGECYRLFTEDSFRGLQDETPPEILRTNLSNVILILKASGIEDVVGFDYLDAPSIEGLKRGMEELLLLGALSPADGSLTNIGKLMADCPLLPPLSRALIEATTNLGCGEEILTIVSLLSTDAMLFTSANGDDDRDAISSTQKSLFQHATGDHLMLLNVYRGYIAAKGNPNWCCDNHIDLRALKSAIEIRNQLEQQFCQRHNLPIVSCGADYTAILKALCAGFFMQCAYKQPDNTLKSLLGRQQVFIHPSSCLHGQKPDCLIYHELTLTSKCYLRFVSIVQPTWIAEYSKRAKQLKN